MRNAAARRPQGKAPAASDPASFVKGHIDMADPFYGEIRAFAFPYAPYDWAFCAGQSVLIQQNPALFAVIGIQFGGDGRVTFSLPDLRGNVAMGSGQGPGLSQRNVGENPGTTTETLLLSQIPPHNHGINVQAAGASLAVPSGNLLAQGGQGVSPRLSPRPTYAAKAADSPMASTALAVSGGGQPHTNMQPFLALNFCICLNGEFPSRP